jgi:hypothetical protein
MKSEGRFVEKILHSKLSTGLWPSISVVLEKVHFFLPRVPRVTIQLFRDNFIPQLEGEGGDGGLEELEVAVRSSYNATASQ